MFEDKLRGILEFLKLAEQLKNTLRNSRTSTGRHESTAEHTWRVCLMVLVLEREYKDLNVLKLLKMIVIHDLGEAINGDIAAIDQVNGIDKNVEERKDLQKLIAPLPQSSQDELLDLWDEYNGASSREALLAKAFDKLETILQHIQGQNPPEFDHGFNLDYGKKFTDTDKLTSLLREMLDEETKRLVRTNTL